VYLVWSYVLFSFDAAPRPGWLVDDVSVTVSTVQPGMVRITNNLWQASYIISGATFLKGKGVSATMTNAPPGQYIVEFADVPYYVAPPAQSNTLAPGGTIVFSGNYTFPDVNHNGISDLWEQAFFGSVSANRSQQTDSDGDGMTDYAEFIAGTDPNSPISRPRLKVTLTNAGVCRLQWPSAAGEQFRVHSSSDLITWVPFSAWLQATGAVSSIDISLSSIGPRAFFRLECGSPTNSPTGLAPNLRFSARRLTSGQWQLDWASSRYRGYQVQGSTDARSWTPLSPWFQATSSTSSYVVPAPAPGAPFLFRLQVQP